MITLNFYLNGFVFEDHASDEVCAVISYAGYSCINNCLIHNESLLSDQSKGLTYMILDNPNEVTIETYCVFRHNIIKWCKNVYSKEVEINEFDRTISLEEE